MSDQDHSIDRIHEAASRLGFEPDAFHFVLDVLNLATQEVMFRERARRHITAYELSQRLCQTAVSAFGLQASEQLRAWNIASTNDFGAIVYSLVELGLMSAHEDESIDDFRELFDLDSAISSLSTQPPAASRSKFYQYRLSTMLVVTTVLAIAFAGYAKEKMFGSVAAVYFAWLMTIGFACWWVTIRDRRNHWLPGAVVGALMIAMAAVIYRFLFVR